MSFNFRKDRENELIFYWYLGTDETVIIPETVQGYTVTAIMDNAFANSKYKDPNWAKYVTLPDSIDYFGFQAFMNSNLVSVNIPKNLKIIPSRTFKGCPNLETVTFHDNIIGTAEDAFAGTNIEIPADILVSKSTTIMNSYYDFMRIPKNLLFLRISVFISAPILIREAYIAILTVTTAKVLTLSYLKRCMMFRLNILICQTQIRAKPE